MNMHLLRRSIYLARVSCVRRTIQFHSFHGPILNCFQHGESVYNMMGRIGGDCPLSERGQQVLPTTVAFDFFALLLILFFQFGEKLREYFRSNTTMADLRVWSSQKLRAIQSAQYLIGTAAYIEHWKALDEIDAV